MYHSEFEKWVCKWLNAANENAYTITFGLGNNLSLRIDKTEITLIGTAGVICPLTQDQALKLIKTIANDPAYIRGG